MKLLTFAFILLTSSTSFAAEEAKESFKQKRAEIREACAADVELHCKGIHGPRNRVNCLKEHKAQISKGCQETLTD